MAEPERGHVRSAGESGFGEAVKSGEKGRVLVLSVPTVLAVAALMVLVPVVAGGEASAPSREQTAGHAGVPTAIETEGGRADGGATSTGSVPASTLNWTPGPPIPQEPEPGVWWFDPASRAVYDPVDGYVVSLSDTGNETWTYVHGVWTVLGPGPSLVGCLTDIWLCQDVMVWDAHDGYVLLYGGWNGTTTWTWTFLHGKWSEVFPATSPVPGWTWDLTMAMAYDPGLQEVILSLGEFYTYAYSNGEWTDITNSVGVQLTAYVNNNGYYEGVLYGMNMAYDPAGGYLIEMGGHSAIGFIGSSWELVNGKWKLVAKANVTGPAPENYSSSSMAYDPALGCMVLYGSYVFALEATGRVVPSRDYPHTTWLNCNGQWVNVTRPGDSPTHISGGTIVYDAADGYMLMLVSNTTGNSTWILSTPALTLGLNVTAAPAAVCSLTAPGCPVGVTATRLTLTAGVVTSTGDEVAAGEPGNSWTWLDAPTLTYVSWGSVSVENGSGAGWTERCVDRAGAGIPCGGSATAAVTGPGCLGSGGVSVGLRPGGAGGVGANPCPGPGVPTEETAPNGASGFVWTWNMSSAWNNSLSWGDRWSVSFVVESRGTVPGLEPVDACVAAGCHAGGSGSEGGWYTAVGYHPYGNGTEANVSFPLGEVLVLGGGATTSVVSGAPPAAPGVPTAVPLPSPVPTPPSVASVPVVTGALAGVGVSLGIGSIAAGAVAAGVARSVRGVRQGVRTAVAAKVGGGRPGTRARRKG